MSAGLCEIIDCPTMQVMLDDTFKADNMRPEKLPFLTYVTSAANMAASSFEIVGKSKKRTAQVVYDQPLLSSEAKENGSACTSTTDECDTYQTYTFDTTLNKYSDFRVSKQDLVGTCEENNAFIMRKLKKHMEVVKLALSEQLADTATSDRGNWSVDTDGIDGVDVNATNVLEVNTSLTGTPRIPNTVLFEQLKLAFEMSRFEDVGIFGASPLVSFARRAAAGGDSDPLGYSLQMMLDRYGIAMMYDRHLTDSLTAINATNLAVGIGSIVPVGFALYEAEANKVNSDIRIADVMYDPETGIKFDVNIQEDCDVWSVVVRATYQFYTWPDDLYKSGSNWEGVKGFAAIENVCTDLQECA